MLCFEVISPSIVVTAVEGRAVTRALIVCVGRGGEYSYIRVRPDEFLLKSVVITVDFKRNSPSRTLIYEYAQPN